MHRLHQMQEGIRAKPKDVVSDYLAETMRSLNVQPGDVWSLTDVTAKVNWGRMRGLQRIHAVKKLQKPETFQGTDEDAGKGKGGGAKKKEDRKGRGKGGGNYGLGA